MSEAGGQLDKRGVDGEPDVRAPALTRLVLGSQEFKVSLSYIGGSCPKNKQANKGSVDVGKRDHRRSTVKEHLQTDLGSTNVFFLGSIITQERRT